MEKYFYSPPDGCTICYSSFQYRVTDSHGATSNVAIAEVHVDASKEASSTKMPPSQSYTSSQLETLSPHPELSQPNTGSGDTITSPGVTNENPPSSGTDYSSICAKLQPVLIQSCSTLVNSDGSLTESGSHAMHCIRNGILLGGEQH
jgi:hypothetical protein